MLSPGNVVITRNWDLFIEWYASIRGIRLRLGGWPSDTNLTLIKLHGSVDWTESRFPKRGIRITSADAVFRIRAVENMRKSWQFIKVRRANSTSSVTPSRSTTWRFERFCAPA
jgi:hypothetical protein